MSNLKKALIPIACLLSLGLSLGIQNKAKADNFEFAEEEIAPLLRRDTTNCGDVEHVFEVINSSNNTIRYRVDNGYGKADYNVAPRATNHHTIIVDECKYRAPQLEYDINPYNKGWQLDYLEINPDRYTLEFYRRGNYFYYQMY